jgi:hypothetical protein
MKISLKGFVIAGMLICFGCAGTESSIQKDSPPSKGGEQKLLAGIKDYEDGNYKDAEIRIQEALTKGLAEKKDQVEAHKYLAFIHCVSGRNKACADEFKKALELDPNFQLQAAEAGHPLWGPVYSSVKGGEKTATESTSAKSPPPKATSPAPSAAPKEAQAAEPPLPQGKILVVVATSVNLRELANGSSRILSVLKKGDKVEWLGQSKTGDWINCKSPSGVVGWIYKTYVREVK